MNIDSNKYYVRSYNLEYNEKTAFKNGQKLERPEENKLAETMVEYDFGSGPEKVSVSSREEFSELMNDIKEQHGDGAMVSISGLGLDFLKISKGMISQNEEKRSIETKALTPEMRAEFFRREQLFGDDEKNILNHSFVNEGFTYQKDFEKAAYGYAKYLNNEISTKYDKDIFYNLQNEKLYQKEVSGKMYDYASNVLSYFMMGKETEEDKMVLSNKIAESAIQYAKNIANGNRDVNDVDTKIKIGDTELTYSELTRIQKTLQSVNEAGISQVHSSDKNNLNYFGLGSNYDTVAYAQLGLRTAQVNYFANDDLSLEARRLIVDAWSKRTDNTVQEKYIKPMEQSIEVAKKMAKQLGIGSNNPSVKSLEGNIYNSKLQKVYDMFSKISGNSKDEFLNSFDSAMADYNEYRNGGAFARDGYVGTSAEQAQLDYLMSTKDIIFYR